MGGDYYVKDYSSGEYEEKKSRFIGELFPISSVNEADEKLTSVRKKHYAARHHCYAYVLGKNYETVKQSDDGEPSQTAGLPILNVLKGQGLHNAILIVTRYFGGVLLGTGGLSRAYGQAARAAVGNAKLCELVEGYRIEVELPYELLGKSRYLTEKLSVKEENCTYLENVNINYLVQKNTLQTFKDSFMELSGGKVPLVITQAEWYN